MIKILRYFTFIPFINRIIYRKYYATGFGTYIANSIFKRVLGVCRNGDFLPHFTSRVNSSKNIEIKNSNRNNQVHLSFATSGGCYYQAINGIEFGENTIWSYGCHFISANHAESADRRHINNDKIRIGDNVWLGSHVVILPGVNVGDNSIIGAGTVLTKSVPAFSVVVGNPGRIIKTINKSE